MLWCRFDKDGWPVYGIVEGDHVFDIEGDPFRGYERTNVKYKLSQIKLLVPVIPPTFYAIGSNYRNHVIERSKWERVGGMDESLAVVANDVDLCLRLSALGYYTVLQPHAIITHVGKASRGSDEPMNDHVRFLARWPFLTELRDPCVPRPRRHIAT